MIVLISMAKSLPEFPYCSNTVWNIEDMVFKSCFSNICLKFNILFSFIFGHAACGFLFPGSGIESGCSAVKAWRNPNLLDGTVGWHHGLSGHEFEQGLGVGDGQGSLPCCSPWGQKESDMNEGLNWNELNWTFWTSRNFPKILLMEAWLVLTSGFELKIHIFV